MAQPTVGLSLPQLNNSLKRKPDFGNAGFGAKRKKLNTGAPAPRSASTPTSSVLPLSNLSAVRPNAYQAAINPYKISTIVPIYVLSQELAFASPFFFPPSFVLPCFLK